MVSKLWITNESERSILLIVLHVCYVNGINGWTDLTASGWLMLRWSPTYKPNGWWKIFILWCITALCIGYRCKGWRFDTDVLGGVTSAADSDVWGLTTAADSDVWEITSEADASDKLTSLFSSSNGERSVNYLCNYVILFPDRPMAVNTGNIGLCDKPLHPLLPCYNYHNNGSVRVIGLSGYSLVQCWLACCWLVC